jgi:acetyl-CoA acyltransferase
MADLEALKTPFRSHGNVTAGNSAGLNDGATACLLASEDAATELGMPVKMRLVSFAFVGVEPEVMGIGPVPATEKALAKAGLSIEDIGLFELNEAFAVQVLAFLDHFGIADDDPRVNQYGGAIATGHPLASSGVRLMTQLARQFEEQPAGALRPDLDVHRHRDGRHRHLGEPAPRRLRPLRTEGLTDDHHRHHR